MKIDKRRRSCIGAAEYVQPLFLAFAVPHINTAFEVSTRLLTISAPPWNYRYFIVGPPSSKVVFGFKLGR